MQSCPKLIVSIVVYTCDLAILEQAITYLNRTVGYAKQRQMLGIASLFVIDNGADERYRSVIGDLLNGKKSAQFDERELLKDHGNVGYGAGHNLAIGRSDCDFHLILNPDVLLEEDALSQCLSFMTAHPEVGLLAPAVVDGQGKRQYLCKCYPSVLDLLLRGFAPRPVKKLFAGRLDRYELHDRLGDEVVWDVPIVSGCFMFFRDSVLTRLQGFSPGYFMYFEDFDISLRTARIARIAYVPKVRITHFGGNAAGKGWWHIGMFLRSVVTFFNRHGWKWL